MRVDYIKDISTLCKISLLFHVFQIIHNPPFSLFREFLAWIMEAGKQFIIIGSKNAITYKEVFPLLKENKIWFGPGFSGGNAYFRIAEKDIRAFASGVYDENTGLVKFRNVGWFTNIDHGGRHEALLLDTMAHNLKFNKKLRNKLERSYGKVEYPKYDNYDAIEVPFTECIPSDYDGAMGVPITFLDHYCPEQFEIIWQASGNAYANAPKEVLSELKFDPTIKYGGGLGAPVVNGSATYARIMIRSKKGADA